LKVGPIRVLVVDASFVNRQVVGDELTKDPDIDVVGLAASGQIALAKLNKVSPDAILLDVEMPEMDGLQTLARLRQSHPKLPVIMFSTLTERGSITTLDAFSLGASDYMTKPAIEGNELAARQKIREELIPKIKYLCRRGPRPSRPNAPRPSGLDLPRPSGIDLPRPSGGDRPPSRPSGAKLPLASGGSRSSLGRSGLDLPRGRRPFGGKVEVVVIGSSTGGPDALGRLLPELPPNFPVPVLIVQHMPSLFTRLLAERLNARCPLEVHEAISGVYLEPGHVWLAPGNFHLGLKRDGKRISIILHQGPPECSCRPSVDVLFRDAATTFGSAVLAVVLTGMGQDGYRSCQFIREAGGQVIAQDEASSVVWGMPGAVVRGGLADCVAPLDQVAVEILRRTGCPSMHRQSSPTGSSSTASPPNEEPGTEEGRERL
jgi:two-component system chemotaxis response regulator CheB